MCEDCSPPQPFSHGISKTLALFPWLKELGRIQNEEEKVGSKCSCCEACLEKEFLSPYVVLKPSLSDLEYTQNGNLITEPGDEDRIADGNDLDQIRSVSVVHREDEAEVDNDCSVSVPNFGLREMEEAGNGDFFVIEQFKDHNGIEEKSEEENIISEGNEELGLRKHVAETEQESGEGDGLNTMEDFISGEKMGQFCEEQDSSIEVPPQHLEFFVGHGGYRLIPVESADSETDESQSNSSVGEKDDDENHVVNLCPESGGNRRVEAGLSALEINEEAKFSMIESMEIEEDENSLIFHPKECDLVREVYEHVEHQTSTIHTYDSDVPAVTEDSLQMPINEIEAEVSIGTEIPDVEHTDEFQNQEILPPYTSIDDDPSTSFGKPQTLIKPEKNHSDRTPKQCCKQVEEELVDVKIMSVEVQVNVMNNQTSLGSELNDIEEERVPDTPTSIENLHLLHKKLLLLEKRESGTEESLDGSMISEFEGVDGVNAIEHLKTALKAERKASHALYAELEEERSASAVAASQTMAMINRLQEEKAAMQMEALQYQRMMEEQSEYDQEALQLLNELMVKREREKEEVERELEVYRKRVLEYESKEKMRILRRSRDGSGGGGGGGSSCNRSESSFACSSNAGDSDGLSIDLNQEAKEEDGFDQENGNHPNTPVDAVLNLEESLANFEQERLSILEQLKVLEERLFTFDDDDDDGEEEQHFGDIRPIEEYYKENGKHDFGGAEANGVGNGFQKEMNGKHHQEEIRLVGGKGKRLLPLFDATSAESEATEENGHVSGFHSDVFEASAVKKIELENKSPAIEEEVDHLYERLQALEADREFLKHCISSMKKGEKGMDLLQEILQHLRDLRNVDHRVKNLSDGTLLV